MTELPSLEITVDPACGKFSGSSMRCFEGDHTEGKLSLNVYMTYGETCNPYGSPRIPFYSMSLKMKGGFSFLHAYFHQTTLPYITIRHTLKSEMSDDEKAKVFAKIGLALYIDDMVKNDKFLAVMKAVFQAGRASGKQHLQERMKSLLGIEGCGGHYHDDGGEVQ